MRGSRGRLSSSSWDSHDRFERVGGSGKVNSSPIGWLMNKNGESPKHPSKNTSIRHEFREVVGDGDGDHYRCGRNRADNTVTDEELSDDEMFIHGVKSVSRNNGILSRSSSRNHFNTPQSISLSPLKLHTTTTTDNDCTPTGLTPPESRIVAPHVGKLAPSSVIEIRLQSMNEVVAVLCSVDVLKV